MWFAVLLSLVITPIIVLAWKILSIHYKYSDFKNLPGPPSTPFCGNLFDLGSNIVESYENLNGFAKKYGQLVRLWFGPLQMTLVISKPEYVEHFLSSPVELDKSDGYKIFPDWLGNGLITARLDIWRKHRKLITPTFHFQILEEFAGHIGHHTNILIEKLRENVNSDYNVYPILNLYTMDVICQTAMNYNLNSLQQGNLEYNDAVKVILDIYMKRFFSIPLRSDLIFRFTTDYQTKKKSLNTLITFTKSVIKQRRNERKLAKTKDESHDSEGIGIRKRVAFLDLLLDISDKDGELTEDEIREEVDTFMFAGQGSISSAIAFSLFEIAKHEDVQEKIYQEVVSIFGEEEGVSFRQLQDLKYLELVIKECMRLYTIVPFTERQLRFDTDLNGLKIPAGTNIIIHGSALHMNSESFPEPDKFDPNRFLAENCSKRHPYAFVPFSAGPRNCIGQKFAMLEVKAALAKIVQAFRIRPVAPEFKLKLGNAAVLKSTNGVPIVLVPR